MNNLIAPIISMLRGHRKTVISIAAIFGSNMIATLLGAVGGLIAARLLGPEETGFFRVFTIPLMYLTILHLGTPDGLYRQLPFYVGKDDHVKVNSLASTGGIWNLAISIMVSMYFIGCAFFSLWHHDTKEFFGWLSQAVVCWSVFYGVYLGTTYRTLSSFVALARIELVQSIINFSILCLLPSLRFYGLCARAAIPNMCSILMLFLRRPLKTPLRFNVNEFKELVTVGFPFFVWIYLGTSLWLAAESSLILRYGGVEGLGFFAIAMVIREGLSILPNSIHQVLMPKMVEEFSRNDNIKSINFTLFKVALSTAVILMFIVLFVSELLGIIIPLLLPKYIGGLSLIRICLFFSVVQALALPLNTLFSSGKSWLYGRSVLLGMAIFGLVTWLSMPAFGGVMAVALGSLVGRAARVLGAYLDIWLFLRKLGPRI